MSFATAHDTVGSRARLRLFGIDAARGFAIFAMVIAHTTVFVQPMPGFLAKAEGLLNDVAAPLFALIIGVTFAISGPRQSAAGDERRRFRLQTAVKAGLLIALGLLLEAAPSGVNVVLDYLGITMLLALPVVFASARTLLIWAGALTVLGPGIVTWLRGIASEAPALIAPRTFGTTLLDWIALGTGYQALSLLPLVLIGTAIGRTVLSRRGPMLVLLITSSVAVVPPMLWQMLDLPGTEIRGGYVEVLRELPLALAAFAGIVLLTDLAPSRVAAASRRLFEPAAVQGRLALSVYVFHVGILMWLTALRLSQSPETLVWLSPPRGYLVQLGLVVVCWAFAAVWWRFVGTGPLERIFGIITGRHRWSAMRSGRATDERRMQTPR